MPNPIITGIRDPKQLAEFQNMLKAVGVPKDVTQIIVGNPIQFQKAQRAFGIRDSHPAFSVYNMGRVYIPDTVIGNPNLVDKYLLHEFGHFASGAYSKSGSQQNLSDEQIQTMEQAADKGAQPYRDAYKLYNSPQGKAYQAAQSRIASDAGRFQPSPTQVQSALDSPLVIGHEGSSQPQPIPTISIGPRIQP